MKGKISTVRKQVIEITSQNGGRGRGMVLFFFFYLFNFDRERESTHSCGRGRERRRERISSRLHTVSTEPDAGLKLINHEIMA